MSTVLSTCGVPAPAPMVLLVDDVADARDVLARLLRLGGYKSVTAGDGPAALAAVESDAPSAGELPIPIRLLAG